MHTEFILVGVIFILIIFVSMYGSSKKVRPYEMNRSSLQLYDYPSSVESFQGGQHDLHPAFLDHTLEYDSTIDEPRSELLHGSNNYPQDPVLDTINHLPGRPECIGHSAGMSNSMGGVCFDKTTLELIKSRGKNFS